MSIAEILDRVTWAIVGVVYAALHYPIPWESVLTVSILIAVGWVTFKILREIFYDTLTVLRELRYKRNLSNIATAATLTLCWACLIAPFIIWIVVI